MNLIINKIAYNVLDEVPEKEEIAVDLVAKFGVAAENYYSRAFFLEVNINCESEDGSSTRSFSITARFGYQLNKESFPSLSKSEIDEDFDHYIIFLKRVNDIIIKLTSLDDAKRPLNINVAIDEYTNNKL